MRYDLDGSLDTSFDGDGFVTTAIGGGSDLANAIVVQPNDEIVVAGHSDNLTNFDIAVGRYKINGSLDATFGTGGIVTTPLLSGDDRGAGVALEADGRIVVVGYTDDADRDHALVRYEKDGSLACGQISLHPTGNGSINTFTIVSGCAPDNWDCVNDQPGNAGSGPAVANDGLTSYLEDGDGDTNREMFALDDGTVPLGATIVELEIRAQVGNPGAPSPTLGLSYQRIGWDGAPVDSSPFGVGVTCCSESVTWTVSGISWSTAELDALEIGLVHVSGGQLQVSYALGRRPGLSSRKLPKLVERLSVKAPAASPVLSLVHDAPGSAWVRAGSLSLARLPTKALPTVRIHSIAISGRSLRSQNTLEVSE